MGKANSTKKIQDILDSIRRIVRALRLASRDSEKTLDLSAAQLFVLQQLSAGNPLSINELAEKTLTHQSSVSVVVSRLEAKGLVLRRADPKDARKMILELSRSGSHKLKKSPQTAQEKIIKALKTFPDAKLVQLCSLLQALLVESGFDAEPATLFFESDK